MRYAGTASQVLEEMRSHEQTAEWLRRLPQGDLAALIRLATEELSRRSEEKVSCYGETSQSKLNGVSFFFSLSPSLFLYIVEIHILSLCLWQEGLVPETGCAATGSLPNAVYEEVESRLFRV